MRNRTFGQLMTLIDTVNQMHHLAAQTYLTRQKTKGEIKLEKHKLANQTELQKLELEARRREMENQLSTTRRKEELIKDIALYAGLGIATIAILITVGVLFVTSKRRNNV